MDVICLYMGLQLIGSHDILYTGDIVQNSSISSNQLINNNISTSAHSAANIIQ